MPRVIEKNATDEMAQYRRAELDVAFAQPRAEDFSNEEEYKKALIAQYNSLRQKEYEYVVRNEAMKAYSVASEANRACGKKIENETRGAWGGYGQYAASADSCYAKVPEMVKIGDTPNQGQSCAISANSLIIKISDELGYKGKDNLIVPKSRIKKDKNGNSLGVSPKNNLSAASFIHLQDSIPQECRVDYSKTSNGPTLTKAIKQGIVGIGDEVSIITGTANGNTTTGCHAMVVVDVQKNEKDEVINYTLQANNPPCLTTIDARKASYYGDKKLNSAVKTSQWIEKKMAGEVSLDMSTDELETVFRETKSRVSGMVDKLHITENHYAEKKHYNDSKPVGISEGFGDRYNQDLAIAAAKSTCVVPSEAENSVSNEQTSVSNTVVSDKEQIKQDIKNQQGELPEDRVSAQVGMKAGRLEKRQAERNVVALLENTNSNMQNAINEDGKVQTVFANKNSLADKITQPAAAQPTVDNSEKPAEKTSTAIKLEGPKSMSVEQIKAMLQKRR